MKKRIIGLDILRVLGIVFIFLYHVTDSYVGLGGTGEGVFSSLALFSILSRPASIFLFLMSCAPSQEQQNTIENDYEPETEKVQQKKCI